MRLHIWMSSGLGFDAVTHVTLSMPGVDALRPAGQSTADSQGRHRHFFVFPEAQDGPAELLEETVGVLVPGAIRGDLRSHQSALFFGATPCRGQPCQKHPSTNTATFTRVNAMSIVRRRLPGHGQLHPEPQSHRMKGPPQRNLRCCVTSTLRDESGANKSDPWPVAGQRPRISATLSAILCANKGGTAFPT